MPVTGNPVGMVLDELHVLQRTAGSIGHGHAVAGLDGGIRREGEDAAPAPRAQDDGPGREGVQTAVVKAQGGDSAHPAFIDEKGGDVPLVVAVDAAVLQGGLEEGVEHVKAGLVGGVEGALRAHAAEGAHADTAVGLAAPRASPVLQLDELPRGLVDEGLDHVLVGQEVRPLDRVVGVGVESVVVPDHGGRPTFGRDRVGPHGVDLGDQADVDVGIGLDCGDGGAQTGGPAPDDEDVV